MIVHMIGNAHIQPAGAWSFDAGRDEALATLNSAVERCEEYPEFKMSFGDIWALQLVEQTDPALFKRIRRLIKKQQWSITHGTFSMTHPYLMSEEMWKRQVTIGHTYCLDRFGNTPSYYINLEAKAFPVSHYHNLLKAGYKGMVFFMDGAYPEGETSSIFRWVNDGGQELLCYRISPHYRTRSHELYGQITESVESASLTLGHTLCFYGVGNHGGGPTKENIEYIRDHRDSFENVELKFSTLEEFFSNALLMSDSFPIYEGPIGASAPGHLLNRRRQHLQQRLAENKLVQAEQLCLTHGNKLMVREVERKLDTVWSDLMTSSNACFSSGKFSDRNQLVVDSLQMRAAMFAADWIWKISRTWARTKIEDYNYQQIVLINTLSHSRKAWIECEPNLDLDPWGKRKLCDCEGKLVPIQIVSSEYAHPSMTRILFQAELSSNGLSQYLIREFPDILVDAGGIEEPETKGGLRVLRASIENEHWALRVTPRGISRLSPVSDKENNFLGRLGISFSLYEDHMDLDAVGMEKAPQVFSAGVESEGWEILEEGKLRVSMINRGQLGSSPFEWILQMYEGDPRIHCHFKIAFSEAHRHLELNIYLDREVQKWMDATSAGAQERDCSDKIHPFHGWTRSICEGPSFGCVSNDFFGFRHDKNCLSFMLLRSPVQRGFKLNENFELSGASDLGVHEFSWVMIPQCEMSADAIHRELVEIQHPPICFDRYEGMNRPPWENSTPYHLQETNERRARKDGLMSHLPGPEREANPSSSS